jgi:hypothetical protein
MEYQPNDLTRCQPIVLDGTGLIEYSVDWG